MKHTTPIISDKLHTVGIITMIMGFFFCLGLVFQFSLTNFQLMAISWPAILILPGAFLVIAGVWRHQEGNFMAAVGGMMVVSGLVLHIQSITETWSTWVYLWALAFPGGAGIAQFLQGIFTSQHNLKCSGVHFIAVGLSFLVMGLIVFELLLNLNGHSPIASMEARTLGGAALVAGIVFFFVRIVTGAEELSAEADPC